MLKSNFNFNDNKKKNSVKHNFNFNGSKKKNSFEHNSYWINIFGFIALICLYIYIVVGKMLE